MYKWHAHCKENKDALKFGHYNIFGSLLETERKDGFDYRLLFEGPTVLLKNFVAISLSFSPQIGYEPHDDDYDVSIVGL